MRNELRVILGIIFLFIFIMCSNSKNSTAPVKFEKKQFLKIFGDTSSGSNNYAKIKADYYFVSSSFSNQLKDSLNNIINEFILLPVFEKKATSLDSLAEYLITDYKSLKQEFPDSPSIYDLERKVEFILNKENIISLEYSEYSFMGGAHPNSVVNYINVDPATGKRISLDELFDSGYKEKLNNIAEKYFRTARELTPEANLENEGFTFENNKFSVNDNFLITKSGIKFYFNDYEVAPHVLGPTEFVIPYDALKIILKDTKYTLSE